MKIKSQNIIITGASSGIGFELAKKTVSEGHNVLVVARNEQRLIQLKNSVSDKSKLNYLVIDITDSKALVKFEEQVKQIFTHVDILINNAGLLLNKPFESILTKEIENVFHTNFIAPVNIIQILIPLLKNALSPHIVNISSMGGFQGASKFAGLSMYSSSKAAIACLTECLAEEYRDTNMKFNCLALGSVQTEMLNHAFPGYKAPLSPSQMADYIYHFSMYDSQFMNGKVIPVSLTTP